MDPAPPVVQTYVRNMTGDEAVIVGYDSLGDGMRMEDGQVAVARLFHGSGRTIPAVTLWFSEDDAAADLGADVIIQYSTRRARGTSGPANSSTPAAVGRRRQEG